MKKLLIILIVFCNAVCFGQSNTYINGANIYLRNTGSKTQAVTQGTHTITDTTTITTMDTSDNSNRAASTLFVHNLLMGVTSSASTLSVDNIAALRSSNAYQSGATYAITKGYYSPNDGGTSDYYWSSSSSATDDGFLVIKPTSESGAGRWILQVGSSINILQAGAKADSITDARPAFKACLAALPREPLHPLGALNGAGTIEIPRGKFYFSDSVVIRTTVNIVGLGAGLFPYQESQIWFSGINGGFYFYENQDGTGGRACMVSNLVLISLYSDNTQTWHGIFSNTVITLSNVYINNFSGDGFIIDTRDSGNADASIIRYCNSVNNRRYGFSFWGNDANNFVIIGNKALANGGSGFHDQSFLGNRYFGFQSDFAGVRQDHNKSYVKIGSTIYGAWNPSTGIQPGVTSGWQNYWVQQANVPLSWATDWSADSSYFDACPFWGMGAASGIDIYGGYAEGGQLGAALGPHSRWDGGTNGVGMIANYMVWNYVDANQFVVKGGGVTVYDKDNTNTLTSLSYDNGVQIGSIAGGQGILQSKAYESDTTVHVYANSTITPRLSYPLKDLTYHSELGVDTFRSATPIIQWSGLAFADVNNQNYVTSTKRLFGGALAAPTDPSFQHAAGEFLWNMGTSSDTIGWKCTVTGRPGTWVAVVSGGSVTPSPDLINGSASADVIAAMGSHSLSITGTNNFNVNNDDGTNNGYLAVDAGENATGLGWFKDDNTNGSAITYGTDAVVYIAGSGSLKYAADYSANYTTRSLVDKEYVDSHSGGIAVDTLYRTAGKDSIQFTIAGRYHAIKDSTGGNVFLANNQTFTGTNIFNKNTQFGASSYSAGMFNQMTINYDGSQAYGSRGILFNDKFNGGSGAIQLIGGSSNFYFTSSSGTASNIVAGGIQNSATGNALQMGGSGFNVSGDKFAVGGIVNTGALFQVTTTTLFSMAAPVMTNAQKGALSNLVAGAMVYCSDCTATGGSTGVNQTYDGSVWRNWW